MTRPHPIRNKDYQKLRQTFDYIAYEIGSKLGRNSTFDERGLTDTLIDFLHTRLNQIKSNTCSINLYVNKPSEKKTGADILFRVVINRPEISFDRYVLLQAKKYLVGSGQFSETSVGNTHLSDQIKRMHSYNPEFSYLLLYCTNQAPIANAVFGQTFLYTDIFSDFVGILYLNENNSPVSIQNNYPITILRSKTWEKFTNTNADNLLNYSETFSDFLLDDLINGKVGKEWDDMITNSLGEFSIIITLTIGQG